MPRVNDALYSKIAAMQLNPSAEEHSSSMSHISFPKCQELVQTLLNSETSAVADGMVSELCNNWSNEEWVARVFRVLHSGNSVLPLPYVKRPLRPCGRHGRARSRFCRRLVVWSVTNNIIDTINCLYKHCQGSLPIRSCAVSLVELAPPYRQPVLNLLAQAQRFSKVCRSSDVRTGSIGASKIDRQKSAVERMLKQPLSEYGLGVAGSPYMPLKAEEIAEPSEPKHKIPLVNCVSSHEADYYCSELKF